eukprot:15465642-Alexandrium_andersonii.AAC.1
MNGFFLNSELQGSWIQDLRVACQRNLKRRCAVAPNDTSLDRCAPSKPQWGALGRCEYPRRASPRPC